MTDTRGLVHRGRLVAWLIGTVTIFLLGSPTSSLAQTPLFDSSFAIGSGADRAVNSVIVQADGKILAGGDFTVIGGQWHSNLARLNSDGQLDSSFPGGTDGTVNHLLQQSDGKILVAGNFSSLQGVARQSIGRLLTNGMVDLDFDAGTLFGPGDSAFALAIQADGKILVGRHWSDDRLLRLNPNGQLDGTFIQTNIFQQYYIFAICVRTNGSILVGGGFQGVNGSSAPGLALLSTNGQVETSFQSPLKTNSFSGVYSIVEQPDSSLLLGGGFWRDGSTNKLVLARLTPSLAWDTDFQPDLFDPESSNPSFSYAMSVRQQPDGKILLGGNFETVGGYWRRCIVRLNPDGRVDPCFDPGMGLSAILGVTSLALQSDGRVLVAGIFFNLMSHSVSHSDNITRLLPQSECGATRVHLVRNVANSSYHVAGTCSPGGTNYLQISSNLVDWVDVAIHTIPYVYDPRSHEFSTAPAAFFRVKKAY